MTDAVIHAEGLGKRYRVGERERYLALRDIMTRLATAPFRRGARNGAPGLCLQTRAIGVASRM